MHYLLSIVSLIYVLPMGLADRGSAAPIVPTVCNAAPTETSDPAAAATSDSAVAFTSLDTTGILPKPVQTTDTSAVNQVRIALLRKRDGTLTFDGSCNKAPPPK